MESRADLFWGLRGGGGNFGVAASLEYRAHPLTTVLGGVVAYALEDAVDVFSMMRAVTADLPDECIVVGALVPAPDGSGEKIAAVGVCHCGDLAQAEKDVRPLRSAAKPLIDAVGPMPYPVVNTMFDAAFPRGARNYWKSGYFREFNDEAVEEMVAAFKRAPSAMSSFILEHFHGAMTRPGVTDTAFPHREPGFNVVIVSEWLDPAADEANIAWARESYAALGKYTSDAIYVNYLADDEASRVRAAYGPNWPRLVELKRRVDPDNFFRLNQNIDPTAG